MQITLTIELLLICLLLLLLLAVAIDLTQHRIPNLLTLCIILLGISCLSIIDGWGGTLNSIGGLLTGLALFLPLYLFGGMGAGDVKLMAAVGTFLGPYNTLIAAAITLIAGGVLATLYLLLRTLLLIRKGQFISTLKSYIDTFQLFIFSKQFSVLKNAYNKRPALRFPYALAIATGSIFVLDYEFILDFYHLKSLLEGGVL